MYGVIRSTKSDNFISFAEKFDNMETANSDSTRLDWILTIVFFVIMVLMIMYVDEWFWVPMPFFLTYLVRALKSM